MSVESLAKSVRTALRSGRVVFESDADEEDSFAEEARYKPSRPACREFLPQEVDFFSFHLEKIPENNYLPFSR